MLLKAEDLSKKIKNKDDTNFLLNNYDALKDMGNHKHAFILSFYFLLRFKPK
jgi:hypothetical protein